MNRPEIKRAYDKDASASYIVIPGGKLAYKVSSIVMLVLGIVSGIVYIFLEDSMPPYLSLITKLIPNFLIAAWLMLHGLSNEKWIVFTGVVFALLCDMWMQIDRPPFTLIMGIASNLLAFVMYTVFFYRQDKEPAYKWVLPSAIVFMGLYLVLYPYLDGIIKLAVFIYSVSYILFLWRASALLAHSKKNAYVAFLGAVMIAVSDGILSFRLFYDIGHSTIYKAAIMLLWWGGIIAVSRYARETA
ncbi:lysoplasmalogenase family protein [Spirochaetia bacterium 38H-sp]|uniref:Lysoplasmalogenase family protein n=1 Tax=Rarispira pelagica TaxID=3141764 RepID=A0ABU9UDJ7_9SPIR